MLVRVYNGNAYEILGKISVSNICYFMSISHPNTTGNGTQLNNIFMLSLPDDKIRLVHMFSFQM